ncbi:type II secretion system protein [Candidatus Saccharibacteria bacterium]|nr:type II secretion system protein [Candidatus Saccharibacteria bacterium]
MTSNNIKVKKGFTIIEVVLVLAVAGLIFMMVFIAFPALQRSQRDTQRRNDYSMLSAAVTSYMGNNAGKLSNLVTAAAKTNNHLSGTRYINDSGNDPNGNPYELIVCTAGTAPCADLTKITPGTTATKDAGTNIDPTYTGGKTTVSQVYVITSANCNGLDGNGDAIPAADTSKNSFAVFGYLESGGYYCQANGASSKR